MIKQVIIVRKDLNMRKGKIAAQSAHASLNAIFNFKKSPITSLIKFAYSFFTHKYLSKWLTSGCTKICVYVNSEEELKFYYNQAIESKLLCSIVKDSGFTEFRGVPTYTAVAIGPDCIFKIDKITQKLPLL
jgi:PTH2 family peptidyl-tRNA hydrolase